ncbi:hypothetical protein Swit_4373 [Rhizorhabdus wittichii RW1]|jgi:hypothetical protein|uniref:Uncharacterized protein n=2 Tax=Rhizorhabdus wittichii TaxID=160791 RepID=A0A9J9HFH5_RHIWR|nr:hypothetical protein Swit_4373 [Rhizorhabdus wittichii RW1]
MSMRRPERPLRPLALLAVAAALSLGALHGASAHKPKQPVLTRETYRQRCLLCHKVPPDGIAPEIVAGLALHPGGPRARDLMPNTTCWRRCEKCWSEPQAAYSKQIGN